MSTPEKSGVLQNLLKLLAFIVVAGVFVSSVLNWLNGQKDDVQNVTAQPESKQSEVKEEQPEDDTSGLIKQIETRVEVQDVVNEEGKIKAVVFVKNNTDKVFSGHVQFLITDDGVSRGTAAFDVTGLNPGEETHGIMWLRPGNKAEVLPFWMEYKFE